VGLTSLLTIFGFTPEGQAAATFRFTLRGLSYLRMLLLFMAKPRFVIIAHPSSLFPASEVEHGWIGSLVTIKGGEVHGTTLHRLQEASDEGVSLIASGRRGIGRNGGVSSSAR